MSETVRSVEGDTIDLIAWRRYGRTAGTTEAVIEANPGIAAAARLAPGTLVLVPDVAPVPLAPTVRLWD